MNRRQPRSLPYLAALAVLAVAGLGDAQASPDPLVTFNGGIGSQPFASVGGVQAANDVLAVNPGGRPWVIRKLRARIELDGTVAIRGKGLILAGGGAVGTAGAITNVVATLFCGGAAFQSPSAPLAPNGDFSITGPLSAVPTAPCASPVLLIRNFTGTPGAWFAAGIPGSGDDD